MNAWQEAGPGEAWVLTIDDWNDQAAIVANDGESFLMRDGGTVPKTWSAITAGHKVFPADPDARTTELDALNESFLNMRDRAAGYVGAPPLPLGSSLRRDPAAAFEWAAHQVRQVRDGKQLHVPPTPEEIAARA